MNASPARPAAAVLAAAGLVLAGCAARGAGERPPLFERLDSAATGVTFANRLSEGPDFNIFTYPYYYNGGGVAVADVNGDGRQDLFFTSNEGPDRLYLNRGGWRFEDVTEAAGVAGAGNWTTGAVFADVNGDRRPDLYVMNVGGYLDRTGRNELFVNEGNGPDGVPRFAERAADVGLDFEGYATHAAFFDYDRDGDLDAYLLNHATHTEASYRPAAATRVRDARASDRLLRNDPGPDGLPRFTDVSEAAGILPESAGYGLSVAVADFDDDGWPDLYVGNDFHESDFLYVNDRDGTFTEVGARATPHTSTFSMGSDAADVDGDGRLDLVVLDMLPAHERTLKTSGGADPYAIAALKLRLGYHHQLARNVLQLNRGGADTTLRFSDVANLAGVAATDWSWAALLADFDLDGRRDLFVTNGIYRRPNDLDYINYVSGEVVQRALAQGAPDANRELLTRMPQVPLANYAFRGADTLGFADVSAAWGLADEGFSNGAAYADLDDDGDLDLVVNNVNAPAALYRNGAAGPGRHALTVTLEGDGPNTAGVGARVRVRVGGRTVVAEQQPSRGFLSSVDPRLHVGLGADSLTDAVTVRWPDGRVQTVAGVRAGRLTLRQADARPPAAGPSVERPPAEPLFRDVTAAVALPWRHVENGFLDFNRERLMPHRRSTEGPAAAAGDVNGDGLDDLFLGGARDQPGTLLLQDAAGRFARADVPAFRADSVAEDVDAAFFDADGDGDLDLYVVSGGNEFWGTNEALRDRLYLGDGRGGFARAEANLPRLHASGRAVAAADVDADGDLDLFVGRQTVPRAYGRTPPSVLLVNDGRGRFADATAARAPALATAGMVSDAAFADVDGDGDPDLVVVGEWMAPRVFRNEAGRLAPADVPGLAAHTGWWNAVLADDLDGDGDVDLVGGNLGLNSRVAARPGEPARYHAGDFDGDGAPDGLLTVYRDGGPYPDATLPLLRSQYESVRRAYPTYAAYGARRFDELFSRRERAGATVLEAATFASAFFENDGRGGFEARPLPALAQLAPTYALLARDADGDGRKDLVLAGNFFGVRPDRGREDAGYGLVLRQTAPGRFAPVPMDAAGLRVGGEVRALVPVRRAGGGADVVVVRNDAPAVVLRPRAPVRVARRAGTP